MRLSELLVRENLIDLERLRKARRTGRGLARAIVELGYVSDKVLRDTIAKFYQLPAVNLDDAARPVDEALFRVMSRELCLKHRALPVERRDDGTLVVAMTDPTDTFAVDDIRFLTGCEIEIAVASPNAMERALVRAAASAADDVPTSTVAVADAVGAAGETAVQKLAGVILCDMERKRASEAIVEPRPTAGSLWFRIDGALKEVMHVSAAVAAALTARLQEMAAAEGCIRFDVGARSLDFAVAFQPSAFGTQATLMLLSRPCALAADDDVAVRVHQALFGFADAARFDPAGDGLVHVSLKRRRDGAWLPAWTYAAGRHASVAAHLAAAASLDVHSDAGAHGPRLLARKAIRA